MSSTHTRSSSPAGLQARIRDFAGENDALVGFAPVERWDEHADVPPGFRPSALWPQARTVIVLGLPILLPMIETTPSIIYTTLYTTANTELDQLAYRLSRMLLSAGHAATFLPRDGYGHISLLVEKPLASFSQVYAAKYAGLGTVGFHHMLITPEFGPRVRFVSIFTTFAAEASPLHARELCTRCMLCASRCPTQAFTPDGQKAIARMDKRACALYHVQLRDALRFPCGVCAKVCPVGKDQALYRGVNDGGRAAAGKEHLPEGSISHFQEYGSKKRPEKSEIVQGRHE